MTLLVALICGMLTFLLYGIVIVISGQLVEPAYPLSCGLLGPNTSEMYTTTQTIFIPVGKMLMPMQQTYTHHYRDLVCTNGTTILKYRSD